MSSLTLQRRAGPNEATQQGWGGGGGVTPGDSFTFSRLKGDRYDGIDPQPVTVITGLGGIDLSTLTSKWRS